MTTAGWPRLTRLSLALCGWRSWTGRGWNGPSTGSSGSAGPRAGPLGGEQPEAPQGRALGRELGLQFSPESKGRGTQRGAAGLTDLSLLVEAMCSCGQRPCLAEA